MKGAGIISLLAIGLVGVLAWSRKPESASIGSIQDDTISAAVAATADYGSTADNYFNSCTPYLITNCLKPLTPWLPVWGVASFSGGVLGAVLENQWCVIAVELRLLPNNAGYIAKYGGYEAPGDIITTDNNNNPIRAYGVFDMSHNSKGRTRIDGTSGLQWYGNSNCP